MSRLAAMALHGDRYRPLDEMLAEIDAVTARQMCAALAAEFFAPERQTVLRLGPTGGEGETGNGNRRISAGALSLFPFPHSLFPFPVPVVDIGRLHPSIESPMIIGVPKEIKTNENRVALVPAGCEALTSGGAYGLCREGCRRRQRVPR